MAWVKLSQRIVKASHKHWESYRFALVFARPPSISYTRPPTRRCLIGLHWVSRVCMCFRLSKFSCICGASMRLIGSELAGTVRGGLNWFQLCFHWFAQACMCSKCCLHCACWSIRPWTRCSQCCCNPHYTQSWESHIAWPLCQCSLWIHPTYELTKPLPSFVSM